ncbi:sigma-70 family RNA polymerase sigma factor, partial [Streptomyces sp. NPDC057540]|uniref:sigma-70 family RNA polymerase sigma factor n=1 Tax=Streptomyces sp. NPDC057540 TaxID=3346160 RepID=UPI003681F486
MALTVDDVDRFEAARPRLEAIAYRLLGSASEAEDAVQDTFLRWQAADVARVEVPEAWLTKVLTNLCLNQLSSARARRETYVGEWLPEPLLTGDPMLGPADTAEQRESVSYAVLAVMERLSPNERAVYVLREAFDYPHREIAEILDITESAAQQTYHRAKKHVAAGRARTEIDEAEARRIVEEFLAAATSGRTEPLVRLLTGEAPAARDRRGEVPGGPPGAPGAPPRAPR